MMATHQHFTNRHGNCSTCGLSNRSHQIFNIIFGVAVVVAIVTILFTINLLIDTGVYHNLMVALSS